MVTSIVLCTHIAILSSGKTSSNAARHARVQKWQRVCVSGRRPRMGLCATSSTKTSALRKVRHSAKRTASRRAGRNSKCKQKGYSSDVLFPSPTACWPVCCPSWLDDACMVKAGYSYAQHCRKSVLPTHKTTGIGETTSAFVSKVRKRGLPSMPCL